MIALSVIGLSLGGCAAPSSGYCDIVRPIWFTSDMEVNDTPAQIRRQVLRHNETFVGLCS